MGADEERAQSVNDLMMTVTAFFRTVEAVRVRSAESVNVTETELRALARVVESGPTTPKSLAVLMAMSTATITAIADRLVLRNLLTRVPTGVDRRSVLLTATDEGIAIVRGLYAHHRETYVTSLNTLSTERLEEAREVLGLITAHLEVALRPDEPLAGETA
ncbi:MAG: MarR family transcriptional regulator [Rhodoglobus sp.]|nr:MarR family transcriptional regulator [Rhodoglobus sp.]